MRRLNLSVIHHKFYYHVPAEINQWTLKAAEEEDINNNTEQIGERVLTT